jgi:serine/threonine-protein kinase RsbT
LIIVEIRTEHDIIHAIGSIRYLIQDMPFTDAERQSIYVSVAELTRNVLDHSGGTGMFMCELLRDGIQFKVSDKGVGIEDVEAVLNGQYKSSTGLGLGLAGAKRLMDELHIDSTWEGTKIIGIKRTTRKS